MAKNRALVSIFLVIESDISDSITNATMEVFFVGITIIFYIDITTSLASYFKWSERESYVFFDALYYNLVLLLHLHNSLLY